MDTNAVGSSKGGASATKIDAVPRWRESDLFDDRERAALALAEGMSTTPADVTDAVFADVRALLTEEETVELVCALAMENYRARFNRAFGVESHGFYRPSTT